jgi:hypothetical protein
MLAGTVIAAIPPGRTRRAKPRTTAASSGTCSSTSSAVT